MFDVGGSELLVVLLIILLLFKPHDLPVIMKKLGHLLRKIKIYTNGFMDNLMDEKKDKLFDDFTEIKPKPKTKTKIKSKKL